MRKRIIIVFMLACFGLCLCACNHNTNGVVTHSTSADEAPKVSEAETTSAPVETTVAYSEPDGVPDSVILRNVFTDENTSYEIAHNYDTAAHIDDAVLTLYDKGAFGTVITAYTYAYQYDRSSDLWELLDEEKDSERCSVLFDKEAFLNNSPFIGTANEYHNCFYSISVLDLDIENMTATIQYSISFESNSVQDLSATSDVELWYSESGNGPYFEIPYRRSMVVMDQIYFMLSIDEGIVFAQ